MATVNTKITDLTVSGQTATARFSSTNSSSRFEVRLDGWSTWRPADNPHTFENLTPGDRTLYARSFSKRGNPDPSPATRKFVIAAPKPDEPPPPDPAWETVRVLRGPTDWNATLIEGFRGATITAPAAGDTRYWLPGPQQASGGRVENQTYFGVEGQLCAYDYTFMIPSSTRLSTHYSSDPRNIISQHHGNNDAGYTGGCYVYPDGRVGLRIRGGSERSMSGSHDYVYDKTFTFGEFKRDTRHHVRLEILWDRAHGDARAQLDGGRWEGLSDVPTWPVGEADGDPSTVIMYRHGWYPQGGYVEGNMEIVFGPLTLQQRV